jgi:hypothetical protein
MPYDEYVRVPSSQSIFPVLYRQRSCGVPKPGWSPTVMKKRFRLNTVTLHVAAKLARPKSSGEPPLATTTKKVRVI